MSGSARDLTACSASPSAWNPGPQLPLLRGISAALVSRAPPTKARRPRGPAPRPGRPARRTHLHVAVVVPGVAAVARVHQDGVEPVQDRLAAALRHVRAHVQELRVAHVLFGEQAGGGSNPPASGRASSSPVPPRTTPDSAAHGATWGNWARSHGGGGETGGREPSACARRVTEAPPPCGFGGGGVRPPQSQWPRGCTAARGPEHRSHRTHSRNRQPFRGRCFLHHLSPTAGEGATAHRPTGTRASPVTAARPPGAPHGGSSHVHPWPAFLSRGAVDPKISESLSVP